MKQKCVLEQFIAINGNGCQDFNIKRKMRVREQDNGETEREGVLEAENGRET